MARFHKLYAQLHRQKIRLAYIDEAHIHRDMDLGYTWARQNQIAWRMSDSAPLSDRINRYGAYDFGAGQCFVWNEGSCNKEHTIQFLQRMAEWLGDGPGPVVIIWDGATWHRAKAVQIAAAKLGLILCPLPAYSPDLNPIENLWRWMREEATQNHCHLSLRHLFDACKAFINRINAHPERVVSRLWPKFELNPEYENTWYQIELILGLGFYLAYGGVALSHSSKLAEGERKNPYISETRHLGRVHRIRTPMKSARGSDSDCGGATKTAACERVQAHCPVPHFGQGLLCAPGDARV